MANSFVMPSQGQVNRFNQSKIKAANIGVKTAKTDLKNINKTPQSILDYQALIASMPSSAMINSSYDSTMSGLGTELGNLRTAQGASNVAGLVGAIGSGIGASAGVTSNAATSAGTISSNDAALLSSLAADFGSKKSADIKDMLSQRLSVTGQLAGAQDAFAQNKMSARDKLAAAKAARATAGVDPMTEANNWLALMTNEANYTKATGKKVSTKGANPASTVDSTQDPGVLKQGYHWVNGKQVKNKG